MQFVSEYVEYLGFSLKLGKKHTKGGFDFLQ